MCARLSAAFAAALILLVPASGAAVPVDAGMRAGVALPVGPNVETGFAYGLGAGIGLGPRYRLTMEVDRSAHALSADPSKSIELLTATAALELALDLLPVIPTIGLGPSYQYAWRPDTGASVSVPGLQIALGVQMVAFDHLHVGAQLRYLTAAFNADTFPAFSTFMIELGWALGR